MSVTMATALQTTRKKRTENVHLTFFLLEYIWNFVPNQVSAQFLNGFDFQ